MDDKRISDYTDKIVRMKMDIVYFDMDGVLADFANGVARNLFGKPWGYVRPHGKGLVEDLGVTETQFWRALNSVGSDFWAELPPLSDGVHLWHELRERGVECRVCTSPSAKPSCLAGKQRWMQKWLRSKNETYFDGFHMTKHKWELARLGRLLLDDYSKHVDAFIKASGSAILWRGIESLDEYT